MPGIIDLPKFNYEDLEEIAEGGQGSFGVNENACFIGQMSHESGPVQTPLHSCAEPN